MMKAIWYFLVCSLIFPIGIYGQNQDAIAFKGSKGNYILNYYKPASVEHPDMDVIGFRLDRKEVNAPRWDVLREFHTPSKFEHFVTNYNSYKDKVFATNEQFASTLPEVWNRFAKTFNYDSLGFDLSYQAIALGFNLLLMDTTANPSKSYEYRVVQLKANNAEGLIYTTNVVAHDYTYSRQSPMLRNKNAINNYNKFSFYTIGTNDAVEGLLIKRRREGESDFSIIQPFFIVESKGDSIIYDITDQDVQEGEMYQYTVAAVNKFGGGAYAYSDTIELISYNEKFIIPKGVTLHSDTINFKNSLIWGYFKPEIISMSAVYRSTEYADGYELVGTTNSTEFVDEQVIPGVKYYYYVEGVDYFARTSELSVKVYGLTQTEKRPLPPYWVMLDFTASKGVSKLVWQDNQQDARGYWVYRNSDGNWQKISDFIYADALKDRVGEFVDTVTHFNTNLVQYAVTIESLSNIESDMSDIITVRKDVGRPVAPFLVEVMQEKIGNRIFWNLNAENANVATGYNVYRKIGVGNFEKLNPVVLPINVGSYRDSIDVGSLPIAYKITAENIQGIESEFSNEIVTIANTVKILPPQNVKSFKSDDGNGVVLTWQPSQSKIVKYLIYRFVRGQEAVLAGEVNDTAIKFVDNKPNRGVANYYFLVAIDDTGNLSTSSNEVYEMF